MNARSTRDVQKGSVRPRHERGQGFVEISE